MQIISIDRRKVIRVENLMDDKTFCTPGLRRASLGHPIFFENRRLRPHLRPVRGPLRPHPQKFYTIFCLKGRLVRGPSGKIS